MSCCAFTLNLVKDTPTKMAIDPYKPSKSISTFFAGKSFEHGVEKDDKSHFCSNGAHDREQINCQYSIETRHLSLRHLYNIPDEGGAALHTQARKQSPADALRA